MFALKKRSDETRQNLFPDVQCWDLILVCSSVAAEGDWSDGEAFGFNGFPQEGFAISIIRFEKTRSIIGSKCSSGNVS